jgi:hypothetical protein
MYVNLYREGFRDLWRRIKITWGNKPIFPTHVYCSAAYLYLLLILRKVIRVEHDPCRRGEGGQRAALGTANPLQNLGHLFEVSNHQFENVKIGFGNPSG